MNGVFFILGAGLGTRLRPLTAKLPKPLLYLRGKRAIEHIFDTAKNLGFNKVVVNTHHLPEEYIKAYPSRSYNGLNLEFVNEPVLLDTGGAIKNILKKYPDCERILVHNGDIFFDGNLKDFCEKNSDKNAASLLLLNSGKNKNVSVNENEVSDMRFALKAPHKSTAQFSGIFIANKKFLDCAKNFNGEIFSSVDVFLQLLKNGEKLAAYFPEQPYQWGDIGTFADYICAQTPNIYADKEFFDNLKIKSVFVVEKGASDRKFFVLKTENKDVIACVYSPLKRENLLYENIAKYLLKHSVAVPEILYSNKKNNLLVMESAGSTDLLDLCRNKPENFVLECYKSVADEIAKLHKIDFTKSEPPELTERFSQKLYKWEQNYFTENLVEKYFGLNPIVSESELQDLINTLLAEKPALIHRDLQSQNIMQQNCSFKFIDFQGMRIGCKYYDIASLVFDPYPNFDIGLREKIANLFEIENKNVFYMAACQRLMQALGAYAFLSKSKGKTEYEKFIPKALPMLLYCAEKAGLPSLKEQCKSCINLLK